MGIIAVISHGIGGNPEHRETGCEGLTFKEGGPIASRGEPCREPWLL